MHKCLYNYKIFIYIFEWETTTTTTEASAAAAAAAATPATKWLWSEIIFTDPIPFIRFSFFFSYFFFIRLILFFDAVRDMSWTFFSLCSVVMVIRHWILFTRSCVSYIRRSPPTTVGWRWRCVQYVSHCLIPTRRNQKLKRATQPQAAFIRTCMRITKKRMKKTLIPCMPTISTVWTQT